MIHYIDIGREAVLPGEEDEATHLNIVSEALARFFEVLSTPFEKTGYYVKKQEEGIPLFGLKNEDRRLLVIPSACPNRLKDYFNQLLLRAYSIDTIELNAQEFLFVDTELTNEASQSYRFFHVLGSVFKHSGMGLKVQVDKLLTFFSPEFIKNIEENPKPGPITNNELRNCIEETCFVTGVEEMREFLLRDAAVLHNIFNKLVVDNRKETQEKGDEALKIKQGVIRLIFGAYLAGDITWEILESALGKFSTRDDESFQSLKKEVEDLNRLVHPRFTNPLWKYLTNRKILIIDDCWEEEGWSAVLPSILLSPEGSLNQFVSRQLFVYKNVSEALHDHESTEKIKLKDFDLILLDLYSSVLRHSQSIQLTNMKEPLWQFIEILNNIRKSNIEKSIPQPMPQVVVFSRDDKGLTVRTMLKELNAVDYFFKHTGTEEHKCGYYSSFRNAVISALKETAYQVGGLTDISARLRFNRWLRQFDPCDRPVILQLMKHFKYFPAANIVNILDTYLKNNYRWEDGTVSILNSHPRNPGRFYISYLKHPNKSGPATLALLSKTEWLRKLKELSKEKKLNEHPKFVSYEDLLQCIVEDILTNDDEEPLCLVFIDDFIGSGGQLKKYSGEFIAEDLKAICEKLFVKHRSKGGVWEKVKRVFDNMQSDRTQYIEIIALFALGVQNREPFEKMFQKFERNNDSLNGIFNYELKSDDNQEKIEITVPIKVHVAHYTRSIQEIFEDNPGFLNELEETLRKYTVIMELRDEDYPCDFEPWGWKANGGLIATYANAQGNTIPVIWRDYKNKSDKDMLPQANGLSIKEWEPLFPRYFNPLTPGNKQDKNYNKKDNEKSDNDDMNTLECKKTKECRVNPKKWDKQFFEEYWEDKKNQDPPCKIKSGE